MLKPTLCFALPFEAKPWIKLSGAKATDQSKQIGFYESNTYDVLISGIGTYKMAAAIGWLFGKGNNKRILFNIGLAGSSAFEKHSWVSPHSVLSTNTQFKPFYPELLFKPEINSGKLLTVDSPATNNYLKNLKSTLVDMEAFGFAKSAQQFIPSTQIHFLKFISDDGADQEIDLRDLEKHYENKINTAVNFIEKTTEILNKHFLKTEINFKEKEILTTKLKLTFSQQVQLENALRFVHFYNLNNRLSNIENRIPNKIKDKYERNDLFNQILNTLYHD